MISRTLSSFSHSDNLSHRVPFLQLRLGPFVLAVERVLEGFLGRDHVGLFHHHPQACHLRGCRALLAGTPEARAGGTLLQNLGLVRLAVILPVTAVVAPEAPLVVALTIAAVSIGAAFAVSAPVALSTHQ